MDDNLDDTRTCASRVGNSRVNLASQAVTPPPAEQGAEQGETVQSQELTAEEKGGAGFDSSTPESGPADEAQAKPSFLGLVKTTLTWVPPQCRYDPENPPKFGLALNLIFALVS